MENNHNNKLTVHNIPKLSIRELIKDMLLQSSILAFVDFKDLMTSNPNFSYYEIMLSLLRKAIQEHEKVCPLFKRSRINLKGREYIFKDNFDAFLNCKISEEYTILVPKVAPFNVDTSLLHSRRSWVYDRPRLSNFFEMGVVDVDYMTTYPLRVNELPEEKDFSEDSYLYYISMEGGKTSDYIFRRQFYFQVVSYLKGVKNNLRYPDMPIELLGGIDEEYQYLQQELTEFYRKAVSYGRLYR